MGARLRRCGKPQGLPRRIWPRADLSANGISNLERGARRRSHPHTVTSLADALGLAEGERGPLFASVPKREGASLPPARFVRVTVRVRVLSLVPKPSADLGQRAE